MTENRHPSEQNGCPKTTDRGGDAARPLESPFTVRFGRLLAGHPVDEPINDPANPNLITSRQE